MHLHVHHETNEHKYGKHERVVVQQQPLCVEYRVRQEDDGSQRHRVADFGHRAIFIQNVVNLLTQAEP